MQAVVEKAMANAGTRIPSLRTNVEHLSGGQRQAIELNRFVHWGGKLVLLDEPFAALGVEQTRRGLDMIKRIAAQGIGVVIITHIMAQAFQVADRIVVIRQGKVAGDVERAQDKPGRSRPDDHRRRPRSAAPGKRNAGDRNRMRRRGRNETHNVEHAGGDGGGRHRHGIACPRPDQGQDLLHGADPAGRVPDGVRRCDRRSS